MVSPGAQIEAARYGDQLGAELARLLSVKKRYDPDGLFTVHHGVGSEAWSADGFVRRA